MQFIITEGVTKLKSQCFNPYLPSWEYIPDGEPYVFDERVYIYGSHDKFNGHVFCLNDYVCWSAPIDDLSDWRYEGVIYKKTDEPYNKDGRMCLYAPDVTRGPDGRYYLYYVPDKVSVVSVAVCDKPAGEYKFYGYVKYPDGTLYGEKETDEPQFDPGVLTEGDVTYLYTGFCGVGDTSRTGAFGVKLSSDMLTIIDEPVRVLPGPCYGEGTGYEGNEYFEAASIRKFNDIYYLIYSSTPMHSLCYATSKHPLKDFKFGGVIVSNCDMHIDTYKPADLTTYMGNNNHGSIIEINGNFYVFYHRHTNGTWFSRQGCIEPITIDDSGNIRQVEMTSQGANGKPLKGSGEYPAFIACNLFNYDGKQGLLPFNSRPEFSPKITQDGRDGDEEQGYIADITDSCIMGFKYFDCNDIKRISVVTRGYCNGAFELRLSLDGDVLAQIPVEFTNVWTEFSADIKIPDGVHALYFTYTGGGTAQLKSFSLN